MPRRYATPRISEVIMCARVFCLGVQKWARLRISVLVLMASEVIIMARVMFTCVIYTHTAARTYRKPLVQTAVTLPPQGTTSRARPPPREWAWVCEQICVYLCFECVCVFAKNTYRCANLSETLGPDSNDSAAAGDDETGATAIAGVGAGVG